MVAKGESCDIRMNVKRRSLMKLIVVSQAASESSSLLEAIEDSDDAVLSPSASAYTARDWARTES
jgi:hypothetical protein